MRRQCDCGRIRLDIDANECIVHCPECNWHYTYEAVPKRLIQVLEQLLVWLKSRGVEAPPSKEIRRNTQMKDRQSAFREMPHPVSCEGCPFLTQGCTVPGGVCVRREVKGVPRHRVGDVLESVGVIEPGWNNENEN